MKKMLVITPDLSLNGANVVLLELLELLVKRIGIHVVASNGGEFEKKLREKDIRYEIQNVITPQSIDLGNVDAVFLNTSSVHYYALLLQNTNIPVHWWFHESYEQLVQQQQNFVHLGLLSDNFHFYGVTPKVLRGLKKLFDVDARLLPMAVKDVYDDTKEMSIQPLVFIPGAYSYIKGQDILLKTIAGLPKDILNSFEFVFAGYKMETQKAYYDELKAFAKMFPNVHILDALERDEVYEYYRKSVCVMAPSRIDSTPTTIVEALMLGKLCIVSDGAGISELMTDCVNGFVYPCEDTNELFKRLLLVLKDYRKLETIQQNARKLYEDNFSGNRVNEWIDSIMNLD